MKVGKWDIPTKLFDQYAKTIAATERTSERYNYEFDELRRCVHEEIVNHIGLMPHTVEYREFQRALRDSCEEMLPERFPLQKTTKLGAPIRGLNG